jgi:phosphoglycerol transferase MdoB-like AlkP superfamily enzyme
MKNRIVVFFLFLIYWYLLFVVARILFLITYYTNTSQLSFSEIANTFVYGFKIDFAIASYIALLPSLVLLFTSFFTTNFTRFFYHTYTLILLFAITILISGDLFMYKHWGFRLDATPLFYMTNLKATTASVSVLTVVGGLFAILLTTAFVYFLYLKILSSRLNALKKSNKSFIVILPLTLLILIAMRGGIGISSLTTSTAYFSKNQFANHAAINPVWNVGFSLTESNDLQRKYLYYSEEKMQELLKPLHPGYGTVTKLLSTNRPNIILIITESLTAKVLEATGGRAEIMPNLNQLVKEGVVFTNLYAASDRTDKGIAAVLAGYPSLPGTSPLKYQKLTEKLAFVPNKLNAEGYTSEFYYGGTLDFANYRSFLVQAGFDKLISDKDFPAAELESKWGAFDHVVFDKFLDKTPDSDKNFFKTILTLTSHEPFETPVEPVFSGNDDETKFMNSLHYTDEAIGNFIKEAKTRKWWDNTLVIIIADHGSRMPGNSDLFDKARFHIPMIWLGGALTTKDTIIENLASQTDLAATLLAQLDINAEEFIFSKNIISTDYIAYSFYTFNNGFGFQKPGKLLLYNTITNTYSGSDQSSDSTDARQGKAYLQYLYQDSHSKNK